MKKSNVLRLRRPEPADPIFFNKDDVTVGTRFRYHGALGHGEWVVERIVTFTRQRDGDHVETDVQRIRVITDVLHLRKLHTTSGETRRATFTYLRYSAIWRIS